MFDFEAHMLSGEPFTIEGLKREFSRNDQQARRIELRLRQFQEPSNPHGTLESSI